MPFLILAAAAVFLFLAPLLGFVFGAFAGWIVGLFFEETIRTFMTAVGIDPTGLAMWQIGGSLGFIGGFFKTSVTAKSD